MGTDSRVARKADSTQEAARGLQGEDKGWQGESFHRTSQKKTVETGEQMRWRGAQVPSQSQCGVSAAPGQERGCSLDLGGQIVTSAGPADSLMGKGQPRITHRHLQSLTDSQAG